MPPPPFLSGLTLTATYLNAAIDKGHGGAVHFEEVYEWIADGTILAKLTARVPNTFDFSIFPRGSQAEAGLLERLRPAAERLRFQERRKAGVENYGLCLLLAIVLDVIQQGEWIKA